MTFPTSSPKLKTSALPRNVWAVSLTSFFMDISSEMVLNLAPFFLANVLGMKTGVIGLVEGLAESTAGILKLFSGQLSDRWGARKWPAVAGYALSALTRPFFYVVATWEAFAAVRWVDRVGKGIRTAPRDALVADSVADDRRGLAFGFQRAADTAGALLGLLIALGVVWKMQSGSVQLGEQAFRTVALISILPAALAVLTLALGTREISPAGRRPASQFSFKALNRPFLVFLLIVGLFELGNSSDAFLALRAQERGVSVTGVLAMLVVFNLVYTILSTPAGALSDRLGRRKLIIGGWLAFGAVYLGFGLARSAWHIWALYALYGVYYGAAYGTSKALIADLVPEALRGTAYGAYNAVLGLLDFPASLIAGLLWQGAGRWSGFGPSAPFIFGAVTSVIAAVLLALWLPRSEQARSEKGTV